MNVYDKKSIGELIRDNTYVGRGIVIGMSQDGKKAVCAYFIMGRSVNSRNRVFIESEDGIIINAFDPSKLADPTLIIYSPVRTYKNKLIVTNGDQTDTIYDYLAEGKTFADALDTREFEPDAPNLTPRISGMLEFGENAFTYRMNILKSADALGTGCNTYNFAYSAISGTGHFLHTYMCDGDPIPTFVGEPERVLIPDNIDEFTKDLWTNLNEANKVSLYVRYTDIACGNYETRLINVNEA